MSKNKILITGSQGFIGRHLVGKLLKSNLKTKVLEKKDFKSVSTIQNQIKDCSVVIHLAGLNRGNSLDVLKTNIILTLKILEAIRKSDSRKYKIIFASTFAVYRQNIYSLLTERSITVPRNYYGLSKLICEKIINTYCNLFGLNSVILRISNVYGPDSKINYSSVVANFINASFKNEKIVINRGQHVRDFIYIDDVVDAFLKVIKLDIKKSEVFNICSGNETSIKKLAETISNISKREIYIDYSTNDSFDEKFVGSFKKSQRMLDWKPKIDLQEGILRTFNSWTIQ